ncbi:hypothetical protein V2G26_003836 [Clonostachys chloroleuca]
MACINVEDILSNLTSFEKVELLTGIDFWHTKALPKYGIPSLRLSDGPNGVRGTKFFNGTLSACFPCGTALGSTFNQGLLEQAGRLMGEEAKAKSAHVLLGPTVNIQRSPLGGRGFESISEDPVLAGLGAAALIKGIQSLGIQATIKHFLCNDQEDRRMGSQCILTERALREIYAMPFQLAVRHAPPGGFMTAYNGINGVFCSENPRYLEGLLRKEWNWDGIIMSDWYGTYTTTEAVKAGLDLEMPGPSRFRGDLLQFNASFGKPAPHIIDDRARAVLNLVNRCAASGIPEFGPETTRDTPETAALLRQIGNESIVLLKNDNAVLPFKTKRSTLVIGPNAKVATYHGGGSAALPAYYAVAPYDGICQKLETKPTFTVGAYAHRFLPLLGHQCTAPNGNPGMRWTVYNEPPGSSDESPRKVIDQMFFSKTEMHLVDYSNPDVGDIWYADLEGSLYADEDCEYELGCVVSGTARVYVDGELVIDNATKQVAGDAFYGAATCEERGVVRLEKGRTYNIKVEFGSAPTFTLKSDAFVPGHGSLRVGGCKVIDGQQEIQKAVRLAGEHEQVIICAGLNSDWETEGADRASMKLPGLLDQLIAEVTGANRNTVVVMQTGTPEEMPWLSTASAVLQAWYGGNETGNCIADIIFGDANPSGKLSLSFPRRLQDVPSYLNMRTESGRILYGEDVYVGYRYYEFADKEVNFPFGHGLSYTTFELSNLRVSHTAQGGEVIATLVVENTGQVAGAEVVQMYIKPRQSKINRPVKELKGFTKVHLNPGESKEISVKELEKYAASYFDEEREQWCVENGEYEVIVSNTSDLNSTICITGSFTVDKSYWWSGI